MDSEKVYSNIFVNIFGIGAEEVTQLSENDSEWDSKSFLNLITEIEYHFGLSLKLEDILGFTSYMAGKEVLKRYGVEI